MAYAPKALDSLFGATCAIYESNGVSVAALKSRKGEGQWDFKGNDFSVDAKVLTGVKCPISGKYYLVLTTVAGCEGKDGIFEIAVKEKNAEGKFATVKDKSSEQQLAWNKGYNTVALLTDGIDNFTILAKVLSELSFVVKAPRSLTAKYAMESGEKESLEVALSEHLADFAANGKPKAGSPILEKAKIVADNGVLVLPLMDEKELPRIEIKDMYGEIEAVNVEAFPFTASNYPMIDKLGIELPVIPAKVGIGAWSGNGGGSATVTTTVIGYLSPGDRAKYICDTLRGLGFDIVGDDAPAIAKAIESGNSDKGGNKALDAIKIAFQMTTDTWIL